MTKEEVIQLAEKIRLGTATEQEIVQYNRLCDFAEATGRDVINTSAAEKEAIADDMKKAIFQQVTITKVRRMNWFTWAAVAASVLLVVVLGWVLLTKHTAETPVAKRIEKKVDASFVVRHEINLTGKEKRIQLIDGSLILLANNSEVTYHEPFAGSRDISLNGKAYFQVAKDKAKPFVVTSGEITTTALGTVFTVTAYQNASHVIVRLYEGKVVIKAVDKANKKMKSDVYLLPGQQFVYGDEVSQKLKEFKARKATPEQIIKEERVYDNPLLPKDVDAPWFMFNNQPLENVLTDLAVLYNVKITYDKKDVQNIYFVAKYNKSESLETILKRIGTLNNLTITKKDNDFVISR